MCKALTFSDFNSPSNECFKELGFIKLSDLVKVNNILLTHKILNSNFPSRITFIFSLSFSLHDHETRSSKNRLLFKPSFRTFKYGIFSITYQAITHWNELQVHFKHINPILLKLSLLKHKLQKLIYYYILGKRIILSRVIFRLNYNKLAN